jgi:hypothetical protein
MSENVPVPQARTITLSGRLDGETGGNRPAIVRPGEVLIYAVECVRIAGHWIDSANNITVEDVGTPSGTLAATILDVRDSQVLITIDGTDAEDGDQWTVAFEIHPTSDQTIKGEIEVDCEDT